MSTVSLKWYNNLVGELAGYFQNYKILGHFNEYYHPESGKTKFPKASPQILKR
jgi:hypothetical protein